MVLQGLSPSSVLLVTPGLSREAVHEVVRDVFGSVHCVGGI